MIYLKQEEEASDKFVSEKALTVEVFDKLTQVKDNAWRLDGIAANMKAMQENRRSHFVKSPLKMAIAVTEAIHEPWVYFSFEKLKALKSKGGNSKKKAEELIGEGDLDHSKTISYEEFKKLMHTAS